MVNGFQQVSNTFYEPALSQVPCYYLFFEDFFCQDLNSGQHWENWENDMQHEETELKSNLNTEETETQNGL